MKYFAVPVHPGDVGLPLRPAASPPGDHEARAPVAAGSAKPDVPPSDVVTGHQRAWRLINATRAGNSAPVGERGSSRTGLWRVRPVARLAATAYLTARMPCRYATLWQVRRLTERYGDDDAAGRCGARDGHGRLDRLGPAGGGRLCRGGCGGGWSARFGECGPGHRRGAGLRPRM